MRGWRRPVHRYTSCLLSRPSRSALLHFGALGAAAGLDLFIFGEPAWLGEVVTCFGFASLMVGMSGLVGLRSSR